MHSLKAIRNIGIIAHIDAGKTTTTERMLFHSGRTHRLGNIDDGNTVMDYRDDERERGITIVSASATITWLDHLVHLIDTPGHIDFTVEVERSLRVIDGALVIFSGVEGVEAQSEKVWHQANRYRLPRIAFVNKLDRTGASFTRVLDEIHGQLGANAVPLQWPVGEEDQLAGVIDLISMKCLRFDGDGGTEVVEDTIPEDLQQIAEDRRQYMLERLADCSDTIAEWYLEGDIPGPDAIHGEIRSLVIAGTVVPVFAGSAKMNIGVQPLLDAILKYLPSPEDTGGIPAMSVDGNQTLNLTPDADAPFSGLVFKVVADASADLYYVRTYTGTLKMSTKIHVPRTREQVKAKRILRLYAQKSETLDQVGPGDIIGLVGPRGLITGDTLCERHHPVLFEKIEFPENVISIAVEPKSSNDKGRLDELLALLCREDPTLHVAKDENTGQSLLSGMGELHLDVKIQRLRDEFNLDVKHGEPRVAYRETIGSEIRIKSVFEKTIGETELYAGAEIFLSPMAKDGALFEVESGVRGQIDKGLVRIAMKALEDALRTGGNFGYPLIYVRARLVGLEVVVGKSNDSAVVGVILQAVDKAITDAGTTLLEPIVRVDILTPDEHVGDLTRNLQSRRAMITQQTRQELVTEIQCTVPLSEMFGFSKALPKLTGGRGSFSMEPCGYQEQR